MTGEVEVAVESKPRRCARWWFPLAAIGLGVVPLAALEVVLRISDPTELSSSAFENVRPLFVPNADGTKMQIAENRLGYFRPAAFDITKKTREKRVFCLGGSTVQGRPYATETSFTQWLELGLNANIENTNTKNTNTATNRQTNTWKVINCGGVSYASYRLTPILKEVLAYEPDLIVLMTGHNEFLEDRELAELAPSPFRLHSATALRNMFGQRSVTPRELLPEEVDALLDYKGGLEDYSLDIAWRLRIVDQYRRNVEAMIRLCDNAGVPVLLVMPVSNLRDNPPFKVSHGPNQTPAEEARWRLEWDAARVELQRVPPDISAAAERYESACEIDKWHAGSWFELGRCREALHEFERAANAYRNARDADVCPLRMTSNLEDVLRDVSAKSNTPLIPFHERVEAESRHGIVDSQWMLDHVHPTIAGHQLLAGEVRQWMAESEQFGLATDSDWRANVSDVWQRHLQNLPTQYFTEGSKRLRSLNRWARGRGDKLREKSPGK